MAKIYDIKSHRKTKAVNKLKNGIVKIIDVIAAYGIDNPIKAIFSVMMLISVIFLACKLGILTTFIIVILIFSIVIFCFDIFMGD